MYLIVPMLNYKPNGNKYTYMIGFEELKHFRLQKSSSQMLHGIDTAPILN